MATFKDHFSAHAGLYARARPHYPAALFDWIASLGRSHDLAWDCGTGNGQAALDLARHFKRVLATDASAEQISEAMAHPGVEYRVATARDSGIAAESADAITVAQALHWFDVDVFYAEADRVLRPRGVLAVWCYGRPMLGPELDREIEIFYRDVVGPYWPPERKLVDDGYRCLDFPWPELPAPYFEMIECWTQVRFFDYVRSWSATRRYQAARGRDPVKALESRLKGGWHAATLTVRWPLHVRAGIKPA